MSSNSESYSLELDIDSDLSKVLYLFWLISIISNIFLFYIIFFLIKVNPIEIIIKAIISLKFSFNRFKNKI